MTLMKLFNEKLKELPAISQNIEELIMHQKWSEEKKQQSIAIVKQIKNVEAIKSLKCLPSNCIAAVPLKITLSPRECGIDNDTFEEKNIRKKADNYIRRLVADINKVSEDIKFSFEGHIYNDNGEKCEFFINWEI